MAEDLTLGGLLSALGGAELVRGDPSAGVLGIEHDSRQVDGGFLFVAVPGARVDGHVFLAEAAAGGATSLLVQRDRADQWSSLPTGPAIVAVDDTRRALSATASWFWGRPSASMKVIGITGTDGKSTTAHLMTTALQASGARVGRLSTVDILIPGQEGGAVGGRMTTPEATEVHRVLRLMVDAGTDFAIVESTSHGLALNRLDHVEYDVAVLTNITGDHLDFHETFEAYRDAKGRLFEMVSVRSEDGLGAAVVNADDPSANYLLGKASGVSKFRYGLDSEDVDVTARQVVLRAEGTQFSLVTPSGVAEVSLRMPALFNVYNALAASSAGHALGIDTASLARGLEACSGIPGRMERIDSGQPFGVVVDYAHTGEAVRKVLEVLRVVCRGRLIIVVGAAGERDPGRRFGVARAAAEGADYAVFTNEDPRSEDPMEIVREIGAFAEGAGRRRGEDFLELEDRRMAIREALKQAGPDDIVVVAGKGHEQSMIYGEEQRPWDDRQVARDELSKLGFEA